MAAISVRGAFADVTTDGVDPRRVFSVWPASVREMARILALPPPDLGTWPDDPKEIDTFDEEEGQGIAFLADDAAQDKWILSIRTRIFKCKATNRDLYDSTLQEMGVSRTREDIARALGLTTKEIDHIGALAYSNGLLVAPIESEKNNYGPPTLAAFDPDLHLVAHTFLTDAVGNDCGYCTINPFNGLLYTSEYGGGGHDVDCIKAYDVSAFYDALKTPANWPVTIFTLPRRPERDIHLLKSDGTPDHLSEIQGAAFSPNGRLYLSRSHHQTGGWNVNAITAFSSITGRRLGEREYDFKGAYDEIEGICIQPSGTVYVSVSSGTAYTEIFWIYALRFADPNTLV
jgi:hypothetical protein